MSEVFPTFGQPGYNSGENNPAYKNSQRYEAVHAWVRRRKTKPDVCDECKQVPPVDLANISGKYLKDLTDWEHLCRRCHMTKDGRNEQLRQSGLARKRFVYCNFCGSQFHAANKYVRFCSKKCFGAHHKNRRSVQT